MAKPVERYTLSAATLEAAEVQLNGRALKLQADDTLPDFPPKPGGALLAGINPAPASVARGHYYQGKLGLRLWKRLESVGLLVGAVPGQEDEAFVAAGHGLTDLVKRVTYGMGIKPCGGCEKRAAALNRWMVFHG